MPRYDVEVFFSRHFVVDAPNEADAKEAAFDQAIAKFLYSGLETDCLEWDSDDWAYRYEDDQPDIVLTPEALLPPEEVLG